MEDYDKEITGAAFYGKTVVVNVSDSGTVNITGWMNAHGAKKASIGTSAVGRQNYLELWQCNRS